MLSVNPKAHLRPEPNQTGEPLTTEQGDTVHKARRAERGKKIKKNK